MKKNILITIIIFGLLIIGLAFYWYQWRPSHITSTCAKEVGVLADKDMRGYYLSQIPNLPVPHPSLGLDITKTYSSEEFAQAVRKQYPDAYTDLSDTDLTQRVVVKYPPYKALLTDFQSPVGDSQYDNYYNTRYQNCLKENGLEK
jgi:hypothetical protein